MMTLGAVGHLASRWVRISDARVRLGRRQPATWDCILARVPVP